MTIAGAQPVGETADVYVIYDDGTPGHLQIPVGEEPALSRAGRVVPEEEYAARLEELRTGTAELVAKLEAEDETRQRGDYEVLRGLGVPEETARRMASYTGGES